MIRFRVLLSISLIGLILAACTRTISINQCLRNLNIRPDIKRLVQAVPEHFDTPYTLIVLLDRQACGGNLTETAYWPQWQSYMQENGLGFVFVTSRRDSAEMVTALEFENMAAPILVCPGHNETVSELWSPLSPSFVLKILIDSTAAIRFVTTSIVDSTSSHDMISTLDQMTRVGDLH